MIMQAPEIVILTRSEVASLLTLADAIDAVEEAFRLYAEGRSLEPGLLHIDAPPGEFHIKAGGLQLDRTYFGLKINGSFFQNRKRYGLPNIQGGIVLFDADYGYPLALMDSIEITIQRTGAAVAVAAKHLARPESSVVTICGCGNQGRVQLQALCQVLPITRAYAYDAIEEAAARFAAEMSEQLGIAVTAESNLERAAQQSDVVATCTPSKRFYIHKSYIRPGSFVAGVGADSPDKQELEPMLLVGSKVVVDLLDQCKHVGELHHALEAGLLTEQDVHGELGAVVAGQVPGRTSAEEITVFDATGTALQDTAAAVLAYERALEAGLGLTVHLPS
jgi:ornithine cyclodeaminase/alanine dehydrogenase